jgi:lysophospholipase L1-like esterase
VASRRRHFGFALAALTVGVLVSLVVGEVAVRVLGVTGAPRRHFRPGIYAPDPELGWVLQPAYRGVHLEYDFEAPTTTNALGYRGPAWDATRSASTVRVLALGDSCTFGRGVGDADTWPARLEARLRAGGVDAAVYDAGVPGYDTVQEEVVLGRLLPVVRPTHVVVAWLPNDVLERSVDLRSRTQILDGQRVDDVERYQEWKARIEGRSISGSALYRFLRVQRRLLKRALAHRRGDWDRFGIRDEDLAYSQGPLERIAARARAVGARPILLLVPRQEEVEPPLSTSTHHARMAAFANQGDIDVVDLPAAWRAPGGLPPGELYLPRDAVHFAPLGYEKIAEAVAERIRESR